MLYRIFGRKKYGKTAFVFDRLKENVAAGKKSFLIVPEQFTFAMEKRVAQELSGRAGMFIEVLSFTRLAHRVMQSAGGLSDRFLDGAGKLLCMSRALSAVREELTEYKSAAADIRFASPAVSAVQDFFSYRVTPSAVERVLPELSGENEALGNKLSDISLIGAAYRGELRAVYGTDGEVLEKLAELLDEYPFFKGTDVFLDSFYSFMPQELRLVRRMLCGADNLYVTIACAKGDRDPIFQRPHETESELFRAAQNRNVPIKDILLPEPTEPTETGEPKKESAMRAIEKSFTASLCFRKEEGKAACGNAVRILRCKNPSGEASAVAACIYRLVTEKKVRYREIAVCARNIEAYEGILDIALDGAKIPYAFSVSEDLLTRPIVAYITTGFEFISSYRKERFLYLLKTGLFRLSDDRCALLEEYIRTWNINGKKEFTMDWYMNPRGYTEEFTEKDEAILREVNEAKEVVMGALTKFAEDVAAASSVRDIALAVYRYLEDSAYREKNEEDDERFWLLAVKALSEIVRVYGDDEMKPSRFAEIFSAVLPEYAVSDIPKKQDVVLIGKADLIRSETIKYMFVIGCNNEYFPCRNAEDTVFSDRERQILREHDIVLAEGAKDGVYDEFFLAYNLFCEPTDGLYLLYSEKDTDGVSLRKSVLLDAVENVFSDLCEENYPFDDPIENLTTGENLARDLYDTDDEDFRLAAKTLLSEKNADFYRLFFGNVEEEGTLDSETSARLYGNSLSVSPSRFDTYSKCRFRYFARHILGLRPAVRAELDLIQTGLISHKILELFVAELAERKKAGACMGAEEASGRIEALLDEHFTVITHTTPEKCAEDGISARFLYLYRRLSRTLVPLSRSLAEEFSESEFVPEGFEVKIGKDGLLSSPKIAVPDFDGASFSVIGQIDRVDVYRADGKTLIRIVDYKTGSKTFSQEEVDYGFNLQMLLYLYCLVESEDHPFGENVVPAGVLYIPVKTKDTSASDWTDTASSVSARPFRGNGILTDDKKILSAMEKSPDGKFIPVKLKKDGDFDTRSTSVLPLAELEKLLSHTADVSAKIVSDMKKGHIEINPYKTEKVNSCAGCEFLPLCRRDLRSPCIRYMLTEVTE